LHTVHARNLALDAAMHSMQDVGVARKTRPVEKSLAEQIHEAYLESGRGLEDLIIASGLDLDAASLSRKLRRKQKLWTDECEALASVLGVIVTTGKKAA
jgi:hypothetical protein